MDWDGMGGSDHENPDKRHRPPIKDFDHHVEVFHDFVCNVVKPARDKPAFLSSHSKGGNIMLRYLHKYEKSKDFPFIGAILGTPLIELNTQFLPHKAFAAAIKGLDKAGLTHTPLPSIPKLLVDFTDAVLGRGDTSRDIEREEIHDRYKYETEDYEISYPTIGWLRAAIKSCEIINRPGYLESIETPVLILSSATDSLVSVEAQKDAAKRLPHGRQAVFKRARHGIWYDIDYVQDKMWGVIDAFGKNCTEIFHRNNWIFYISLALRRNPRP